MCVVSHLVTCSENGRFNSLRSTWRSQAFNLHLHISHLLAIVKLNVIVVEIAELLGEIINLLSDVWL